ncbi:Acg family FMN-binding oxidoreductase [Actinomadura luteofluorescens]|uniref:Acg family FMN-binding oxidoreductase n=1 Tax=Actinomadura luteofluorescens TaxID=46163 RepID=UPI00347FC2FE
MQTRYRTSADIADDIRRAVEDAMWAPSVHNTQPWRFGVRGSRVSLRADPDRRLGVADPQGREMLISCGAALYNLRLSLRAQGYDPVLRLLPDPDRPHLLADVVLEPDEPADRQTLREHAQIERRRSHRGAFRPETVPAGVLSAMRYDVEREGARLIEAVDQHVKGALAALTDAAEHIRHRTPAYSAEMARWAPSPRTTRKDGVQESAYPKQTPETSPNFPGRDFARGQGWGAEPAHPEGAAVAGVALLLVSDGDGPADWLRTGQALQRALLRAAESDLAAAFHTQALEVPELRAFIRTHFCRDAYPQMLLRIGTPEGERLDTVRRPVDDVMVVEP